MECLCCSDGWGKIHGAGFHEWVGSSVSNSFLKISTLH